MTIESTNNEHTKQLPFGQDASKAEVPTRAEPALATEEPGSEEGSDLEGLLTQYRRLIRPLVGISDIKPRAPDALAQLEKALRLPPGVTFGPEIAAIIAQIDSAVRQRIKVVVDQFRISEATFVRGLRDAGEHVRELNHGWRIGPLEFQFQRQQAQARVLYNHEVLAPWVRILSDTDLEKLRQRGLALLQRAALPNDLLLPVLDDAYRRARSERVRAAATTPDSVPVLEFYREVRIALVRHDISVTKPDAKVLHADLTKWAFLYNLDLYLSNDSVPLDKRLGFQTGSQAQSARNQCITLNGLDASKDYKEFCYVLPPRRAAT